MFRLLTRRSEPAQSASSIDAAISGEVSGQVAVGERITQYHAEHGAIINVAGPGEQPLPSLRSGPVSLRPRDFPGLLGREAEVEEALSTVRSNLPMEFHGRAGLGKTALLRHLSHRTDGPFPDGVVYLVARDQGSDDLAQFLFDSFYERSRSKGTGFGGSGMSRGASRTDSRSSSRRLRSLAEGSRTRRRGAS